MQIVGCDLHTRYQQVAMLDQETGELMERRLDMPTEKHGPSIRDYQPRCEEGSKPPATPAGLTAC